MIVEVCNERKDVFLSVYVYLDNYNKTQEKPLEMAMNTLNYNLF